MKLWKIKTDGKDIAELAEETLKRAHVTQSPVSLKTLRKICRKSKIIMAPYSKAEAKRLAEIIGARYLMKYNDGFVVYYDGSYLLFWDDSLSKDQQTVTFAHEIGHVVLGDLDNRRPVYAETLSSGQRKEMCADAFALHLLHPSQRNLKGG